MGLGISFLVADDDVAAACGWGVMLTRPPRTVGPLAHTETEGRKRASLLHTLFAHKGHYADTEPGLKREDRKQSNSKWHWI